MLFKPTPGVNQARPGGDGFTLPPRGALGRRPLPKGLFLRGRRRSRESEFLPLILFLLFLAGTAVVASNSARLASWSLALACGVSVFAVCVRFVYSAEGERLHRAGRAGPGFLEVIVPRFPAVLISLLVLGVWLGVVLLGPFPGGAGGLFLALLGFSFALIIGKCAQRILDEMARNRELGGPPDDPV